MKQGEFKFRTWGGARKGAGRPPKGEEAGVPHLQRPALKKAQAVHVTVSMLPHVWNLRSRRSFRVIGRALYAAAQRFAVRICQYSIQGNHIHLVAEAGNARDLGRSMKGFGVRVARGLNRMMGRRGRVVADRYHGHVLRTPTEIRHAVHYVANDFRRHAAARGVVFSAGFVDTYSSATREVPLPAPEGFLLGKALAAGSHD